MNSIELSKSLAYEHFQVEPALTKVAIFTRENDSAIRLVEVNTDTIPSGCVQPFVFRPTADYPLPVFVADITPSEWEDLKQKKISMPAGWPDQPVEVIDREAVLTGAAHGQ